MFERPLRLLISAAEISGDTLAAGLLKELRKLAHIDAMGVAGPAMRSMGVRALMRVEQLSANGLVELLGHLGQVRNARAALQQRLAWADLLILVDAPDLHLPLGKMAKSAGIPVVGYVCPQIWAWRAGRARTLGASLDRILCLFSFEPALLTPHGVDARFAGHPAVDRFRHFVHTPQPNCFALLPGSRPGEIRRHLPLFLEAASRITEEIPSARFRLGLSPSWKGSPPPTTGSVHLDMTRGLEAAVAGASAALVASGTATLELALLGIPMVVVYKVNPITFWVGKRLVKGVGHIALPNILAGGEVVPEHVGHIDPMVLARDLVQVAAAGSEDLGGPLLRSNLGAGGSYRRAAKELEDLLPPFSIRSNTGEQ